eukprot:403365143
MEKTSKDLQKEQIKREKEEALEKQTSDDFSAKKTKAQQSGGDLVKQLAAWLDNPPFKSKNSNLKFETFYAIMNLMGQLKPDNIEKIASLGLDAKQAITLSKYIFKAFDLLDKRDQKTQQFVNQNLLLKVQLKIQEKFGQSAILKAGFEKNPIC